MSKRHRRSQHYLSLVGFLLPLRGTSNPGAFLTEGLRTTQSGVNFAINRFDEMVATRRSARLEQLRSASTSGELSPHVNRPVATNRSRKQTERPKVVRPKKKTEADDVGTTKRKRTPRAATTAKRAREEETVEKEGHMVCLPRTREKALKSKRSDEGVGLHIIGVDEAGRGPLAGPVVAAAAIVPSNITGVTDSKKITSEEAREVLYDNITNSPGVRWAAAIIDAPTIDEINILQATLRGMRLATEAVIHPPPMGDDGRAEFASADRKGCYVVCGRIGNDGKATTWDNHEDGDDESDVGSYYALVDGNRVPPDMPCDAEAMVKGDSREFAIGASSLVAKVIRDRLMREYDTRYPEYGLGKHKGYPTAVHMSKVRQHGASPIHRRTFAPLKHMTFDEEGRIC